MADIIEIYLYRGRTSASVNPFQNGHVRSLGLELEATLTVKATEGRVHGIPLRKA
jgi:hypothetical protein